MTAHWGGKCNFPWFLHYTYHAQRSNCSNILRQPSAVWQNDEIADFSLEAAGLASQKIWWSSSYSWNCRGADFGNRVITHLRKVDTDTTKKMMVWYDDKKLVQNLNSTAAIARYLSKAILWPSPPSFDAPNSSRRLEEAFAANEEKAARPSRDRETLWSSTSFSILRWNVIRYSRCRQLSNTFKTAVNECW